jgi:biotin carboxyl carrier protein
LVVLEAMKMENEITAPVDGRVTAVHVNDGQAVDKGTVLVEVTVEG